MALSKLLSLKLGVSEDAAREKRFLDECFDIEKEMDRLDSCIERWRGVLEEIRGLSKCCEMGFMASEHTHWLFVKSYAIALGQHNRIELTRIECIVIPEIVHEQSRHRPAPNQDPAEIAASGIRMTSTTVSGREIAEEAVAEYATGVRLGTADDILVEPCEKCGRPAVVVCTHRWDFDYDSQVLAIYRLCLLCPLRETIASLLSGEGETLSVLPTVE